jgi:hypothetical protein
MRRLQQQHRREAAGRCLLVTLQQTPPLLQQLHLSWQQVLSRQQWQCPSQQ